MADDIDKNDVGNDHGDDDSTDTNGKPAIDNGPDAGDPTRTASDSSSDDNAKTRADPGQADDGKEDNEKPRGHSTATDPVVTISWPLYGILLLLVVALVILILRGLPQDPDTEEATVLEVTRVVQVTPDVDTSAAAPAAAQVAYPPEEFFVQNQLIVSGPEEAVDIATGDLIENETISQPTRLSFAQIVDPNKQCPGLSERPNQGQDLVIDRYTILDEDTDVATLINRIQNDQVIAEPNRITGSPWEIEGSPWEIEGSPWEIEGGSDGSSDAMITAEAGASPGQWAFGKHGIDLPALPGDSWPTGNGILVGVFDTLPFSTVANQPREITVDWVTEPEILTFTALSSETDADLLSSGGGLGSSMINHGLFVVGLVHAAAPDSDIQLIRVLDKDNRGDLFALTEALYNFLQPSNRSGYDGAVINMSLGIRIPPLEARGFSGLTREVHSLQDLIAVARCSGVVVVAAAGNNSAKASIPELPNLPAAWSSVIGVGASNINKGRSCFSNLGDIGAPGGDGRETDGPTEICRPRNHECLDGECPFAVIGPISQTLDSQTGYAYWTGSSFAAPMVSGLAAQVLEKGGSDPLTPADVRAIIECGATPSNDRYLGAGVINVRRTIDECIPAQLQSAAE